MAKNQVMENRTTEIIHTVAEIETSDLDLRVCVYCGERCYVLFQVLPMPWKRLM